MAFITIDCRTQPGTYASKSHAIEAAIRKLSAMPVGTVAAVWEGDTQTAGLQVRRILKEPTIIVRDKWPRETPWRVAHLTMYSAAHHARLNKAAARL